MTKKLAIIDSDNKEIIAAIEKYFECKDVEIQVVNQLDEKFDLVVLTGFEQSLEINSTQVSCFVYNHTIHYNKLFYFKSLPLNSSRF